MGNYGFAVSQKGYDVKTCADKELTFSSAFRTLKIFKTYTGNTTIPPKTGVGGEYNYSSTNDYIRAVDSSGSDINSNVSIDSIVYFDGADDPPDPLEKNTNYYVVEIVDSSKFKISTTKGGSVIDILPSGSMDSQWHGVEQINYVTFTHNLDYLAPFLIIYNGSSTIGTANSYFMSDSVFPLTAEQHTTYLRIEVDENFDQGFSNTGDTVYFTAYQFIDDLSTYTASVISNTTTSKTTSADYGFAISKEGYDVKTCSEKDLVLSSSYFTNTIQKKGTATSNFLHGLNYIPSFISYTKYSGDSFLSIDQFSMICDTTTAHVNLSSGDTLYYVIFKSAI